jgi:hypothetical protein
MPIIEEIIIKIHIFKIFCKIAFSGFNFSKISELNKSQLKNITEIVRTNWYLLLAVF